MTEEHICRRCGVVHPDPFMYDGEPPNELYAGPELDGFYFTDDELKESNEEE